MCYCFLLSHYKYVALKIHNIIPIQFIYNTNSGHFICSEQPRNGPSIPTHTVAVDDTYIIYNKKSFINPLNEIYILKSIRVHRKKKNTLFSIYIYIYVGN